jgi:hypothetical protein
MADKKISALPPASTPLAGSEVLPIVQGGTTEQVSVSDLTAGRAVTMSALGVGVAAPATGINATANTGLPSGTVAGTNFWLVGANGTANTILFDAFNTVSVIGRRSNGTLASPSAISSNTLFTIGARGYGATGYSSANRAQIGMVATEAWTDSAQGAQLTFATTANGGTTLSTRMTIDNAGNVGVGSAPISGFSVAGTTGFTWSAGGTSSGLVTIGTQGTSGSSLFVNTPSASSSFASGLAIDGTYPGGVGVSVINLKAVGVQSGGGYGSDLAFHTSSGAVLTEQMRISSAGNVRVGTNTFIVSSLEKFSIDCGAGNGFTTKTTGGASTWNQFVWNAGTSGNNAFIEFGTEAAYTARGSITYNRGANQVAYNITSDVRLKKNIVDAADAGSIVDAIKVRQFDWVETSNPMHHGFVAQELYEVAPVAVTKPEDDDSMWAVDYSKLVPILVKEIQSLRARVAQLEGK